MADAPASLAIEDRWNHNIHYHSLILEALPPDCGSVLDVGCGEGLLALELSRRVRQVTAIDLDEPMLELARHHAATDNIDYVQGDLFTYGFEPASFDAVVSNVVIHHMDTGAALTRMAELLRPGGRLVVCGVARNGSPVDLGWALAGTVGTRLHRLSKTYWETAAPKVWPPPLTFGQTRRLARQMLPGARFRHHILFRYSLTWVKPY